MIGSSLAYRFVGNVVVLVHANRPPDPEEFSQWIADTVKRRPEASLVVTPGPGPSPAQRKEMLSRLREAQLSITTAIVTDSTVARGIVTALGWFQEYALRAFAPPEMSEAIAFIDPSSDPAALGIAVREMQRALLGPAAVAG